MLGRGQKKTSHGLDRGLVHQVYSQKLYHQVIQYNYMLVYSAIEEQLEIERLKLYQAIGYTEGGKTANYPKEVSVYNYIH